MVLSACAVVCENISSFVSYAIPGGGAGRGEAGRDGPWTDPRGIHSLSFNEQAFGLIDSVVGIFYYYYYYYYDYYHYYYYYYYCNYALLLLLLLLLLLSY